MSILLANFGASCCVSPPPSPLEGSVTIAVDDYDTDGYTGGGYAGEASHFCFDVLVTINDGDDDWTGGGVTLSAANSATFRLVPSPGNPPVPGSSEPDKYATFFSQPYGVNSSSRFTSPFTSGGMAGKFSLATGTHTYTTTSVDAAWFDASTSSSDGPAAVLRIVIDVSGVSGADTSSKLGSVYYSTSGPAAGGDIKVADMTFKVAHAFDDSGSVSTTGSFYVKG